MWNFVFNQDTLVINGESSTIENFNSPVLRMGGY